MYIHRFESFTILISKNLLLDITANAQREKGGYAAYWLSAKLTRIDAYYLSIPMMTTFGRSLLGSVAIFLPCILTIRVG